ncbi:hypothetical protein WNY37_12740 [Henriciella sp. AS95]|uniref:hypothetical protein n=1 Tax=Henriciella sp. AS95 TaxID=3135782 RepID=UPI003170EEDF
MTAASSMRFDTVARDAFAMARRVMLPTAPALLLFAVAVGIQSYFNTIANHGGQLVFLWMTTGLITIFVGCFWSADMYRRILPEAGTRSVISDAIRLFLANLAIYGLYFVLLFLLTLFFSIFAGVLIGSTGYDPSETLDSSQAVWESIRALSSSGGAVVLYLLLLLAAAGLVWLGLRLFLFGVATVAERDLTIFRSWPWTSKHVSRIALLWVFLQLIPWLVLTLVATGVMYAMGFEAVFSFYTGAAEDAEMSQSVMRAVATGLATLVTAPFYWLGHGLAAALYQRLAPNRVDADTTFG